jgi:hypothetical protein
MLVRFAQSRISVLKKLCLIALQQQEVILWIWITLNSYESKDSSAYLLVPNCVDGGWIPGGAQRYRGGLMWLLSIQTRLSAEAYYRQMRGA